MKFLSLELKGYKRIQLNNINYIKITPKNKLQLILGSNGSGKSSILKEFTPLPAISSEYEKDGYKIAIISHNNSIYNLKSIFNNGSSKYYFIKDDEELNPGNTVTVFKELVKKEFNITQDVHDIFIGNKSFHDMSTNERKNWFTKISNIDYNFAFSYFNKLKEQLRDTQSILKYNQNKLVQESSKVLSKEEEIKTKEELLLLKTLLSDFLSFKNSVYADKNMLMSTIEKFNKEITSLSDLILLERKRFIYNNYNEYKDIDLEIIDCQSCIKSLDMSLIDIYRELQNENETLIELKKSNIKDINTIDSDIEELHKQINRLYSNLIIKLEFNNPKESLQSLNTIIENLIEIFIEIDTNINMKYSRDKHIHYNETVEKKKKDLDIVNKQLDILLMTKKELEHLKEHNKIECPKCSHTWSKGYEESKYLNTLSKIESIATVITTLKTEIAEYEKLIIDSNVYMNLYKTYMVISKNWPMLNQLWDYLLNSNLIFNNPKKIPSILESIRTDLYTLIKIEDIKTKISEILKIKNKFKEDKELDLDKLTKELSLLERKATSLKIERENYNIKLNKLIANKALSIKIYDLGIRLNQLINTNDVNLSKLTDSIKQNYINNAIEITQLEISKYEIQLSRIDSQRSIITNLEHQITELTNKAEILKIAIKELSPSEGLIAESLSGFINFFVLQVNSFIKKVWIYPLELIPIVPDETDDIDLDYKFAVKINGKTPIPDITKASTAMKEIINLAFKLVSMQYLGLNNYPVYLDELGSSFDKAHRGNVILLIQNLLSTSNFSQIFIISHYEEMFGSLKNADVTVLCSANIPVIKNDMFNSNSIIK